MENCLIQHMTLIGENKNMTILHNHRYRFFCLILGILLLLSFFLSFLCGRYSSVSITDIIHLFLNKVCGSNYDISSNTEAVILQLRLPRIIGACLIGTALAISGCAYQALFGNPIASPDTLGVSNAASFAAVLGIILNMNSIYIEIYLYF